jgi:PTS system nitrogen regulatory IIA component
MLGKEIDFSGIRFGVKGDNPEQIIKNLSWVIARETPLTFPETQKNMEDIFKKSVTGIGDGVAVFDWVSEKAETPYLLCAKLESAVQFPSVDDRSVDMVLVLVSPQSKGSFHLQHLSRVTRMFRESKLLEKLRSVSNVDGLHAILLPENRRLSAA